MENKDILLREDEIASFMRFLERGDQVTIALSNTKEYMYRVTASRDIVDNYKLENY